MDIRFNGKRAIVTGAGKEYIVDTSSVGIGRAIARKLAECGAETIAISRTQADLDSLQAEVPGIQTVQVDLGDWDATRSALGKVGPVDLLVNNAGISILEPFLEMKKESLDSVMNVNFSSVFNVSQVVAKGMVEKGQGGAIVNISSAASMQALREHANYCCSKAAVDMLTKIMALELGPHKIRVNSVNPTVVLTAMGKMAWSDPKKADPMLSRIPWGKFVEVEDVVNAVLYLLSDKSGMIHGTSIPIEGGLTCN